MVNDMPKVSLVFEGLLFLNKIVKSSFGVIFSKRLLRLDAMAIVLLAL